jgi:signal transduction histidine kinase/ligand-binding sensor domain-containing protein
VPKLLATCVGRCFVLLICFCGSATQLISAAPTYFIRNWEVGAGLPENNVTSVLQSRDGYIWLGTRNGLVRFDGVRFTSFDFGNTPEMHSPHVTALCEDANGVLWIGHETGELTRYENGHFQEVPVKIEWRGSKVLAIAPDSSGDLWLLNKFGDLARLRDGTVIAVPAGVTKHLVSLVRNPQGGVWVRLDSDIFLLEKGTLKKVADDAGRTNRFVQGICASRDGGLWVVVENVLRKWKDGAWLDSGKQSMLPWAVFHTMIETSDGKIAAGTSEQGLQLTVPGLWVSQFNHTNGLGSDWVTSLCEDREGNIWTGTANGGLAVLRSAKVTTLSPPDSWQGRAVLSVAAGGDGSIWVGTEGAGLYQYSANDWIKFDSTVGLLHRYIWSVALDEQSRVWAGSWGDGVFIQNGKRFELASGQEKFPISVTALCRLRNGDMCVGTGNGLLHYHAGKTVWLARKPQIVSPDVRSIAEGADGRIWFGMSGGGLGCYEATGNVRQFRRNDGLGSDFVQCLRIEPDGTLWIGTFGAGLNRFKNGKFASVTSRQGLANDVICDIQEDDGGFLWVSSHGGISRVSKADLNRCADDPAANLTCITYGLSDGMPTIESSGGFQPASCRTPDGRLWFPTSKGLVAIDPHDLRTNSLQPPVLIEQMRVDGREIPRARSGEQLRIPPGPHRLDIEYTALSFVAPERVRFKSWLVGLERDWVDAGNHRAANYNYVPPGDYTFRVAACNNDGVWNETGAQVAFTVLPFFWQTVWFRFLVVIGAVGAGGALVWYVTRQRMRHKLEKLERQRAIELERARIANDIHDDLGSHLTRITMLSETARSEVHEANLAHNGLSQIYDTACELTLAMDEIVWAVNPRHDTLEGLTVYLEKFAFDFLEPANIRCRLDFPVQLPAWWLTSEIRHNLFLAFKEALNNVVRHSRASEVSITLELDEKGFQLAIEDNGKGFDISSAGDRLAVGNGLENMRQRLQKIGGSCEIQSYPGQGARITFRVLATVKNESK